MRCTCALAAVLLSAGLLWPPKRRTAPAEEKDGFVGLSNSQTLNGWQGDVKHYAVKDGVMTCHGGVLYTAKEYCQFRFPIRVRALAAETTASASARPWCRTRPITAWKSRSSTTATRNTRAGFSRTRCRGRSRSRAGKTGCLKPTGQWNHEEIVADGRHIRVTLNGTVITDADISKVTKTLDHQKHPGLHNPRGYIAWLGHGNPDGLPQRADQGTAVKGCREEVGTGPLDDRRRAGEK